VQIGRWPVLGQLIEQAPGKDLNPRAQCAHVPWREVWLQKGAHPRVVGVLGGEIAQRSAELCVVL